MQPLPEAQFQTLVVPTIIVIVSYNKMHVAYCYLVRKNNRGPNLPVVDPHSKGTNVANIIHSLVRLSFYCHQY